MDRFWVVWSPSMGTPTVMHDSEQVAKEEAERLAAKHPGTLFYLLESVCYCRVSNVTWEHCL